jgi:cyclic pyranopterin phosphate synthase
MPFAKYEWIERQAILTYEEIVRLASLFLGLGASKIRLTGGEPLLRKDLERLVGQLSRLPGLEDLSLTTNGSLLAEQAAGLRAAGLKRINVSLDTLRAEKFRKMTRWGDLSKVLEGLYAAQRHGFSPIKINAVVERGVNDDEIIDLVEFSRKNSFAIRFIEYMDVGNANNWQSEKMVSKKEILEIIHARFPLREIGRDESSAPAVDFEFVDGGGEVGVIASVTEPFCAGCTRARLTADGKFVTCLFSEKGHDLKALLRNGASDDDITEVIAAIWKKRADRYSDERLEALNSAHGYRPAEHKKIEMIRLGG